MNYVLNRSGLLSVFQGLAQQTLGLSPGAILWDIDPNPIVGDTDRARVTLDVLRISALGVDEHRRLVSDGTDGYPAGTYWVQELGAREIFITLCAEAFDRAVESAEIIDQLRSAIRWDATTQALNAINLAFVWAMPAVRLPLRVDSRAVNAATADFEFSGISQQISQIIPPGVGGDYIKTVDGNNQVPGTLTP